VSELGQISTISALLLAAVISPQTARTALRALRRSSGAAQRTPNRAATTE